MSLAARRGLPSLLTLALLACLPRGAAAESGFSSLEERMSYKEFTTYGLDHLTPEQLRGLNEWLRTHGTCGNCGSGATETDRMTAQPAPIAAERGADRIVSRVAGEFSGWHQGSVITLENGQHWEVRDEEPFVTSREQQPRATVERGLLDGWTLTIEGHVEIAHVVPASKR